MKPSDLFLRWALLVSLSVHLSSVTLAGSVMSRLIHTHTLTLTRTLTHTLSLSLTHTHTLSLSHTHTHTHTRSHIYRYGGGGWGGETNLFFQTTSRYILHITQWTAYYGNLLCLVSFLLLTKHALIVLAFTYPSKHPLRPRKCCCLYESPRTVCSFFTFRLLPSRPLEAEKPLQICFFFCSKCCQTIDVLCVFLVTSLVKQQFVLHT